jgi:hypothetical protein
MPDENKPNSTEPAKAQPYEGVYKWSAFGFSAISILLVTWWAYARPQVGLPRGNNPSKVSHPSENTWVMLVG